MPDVSRETAAVAAFKSEVHAIGVENHRLRLGFLGQRQGVRVGRMGLRDANLRRRRRARHLLRDFRRHQDIARVALKPCLDPGKGLRPALVLAPAGAALIDGLLEFAGVEEVRVRRA